jgi:hypothetical protein
MDHTWNSAWDNTWIVHVFASLVIATVILVAARLWRGYTSRPADARLCPKCLFTIDEHTPHTRCPECGLDLAQSGVIAAGTRLRKRVPFAFVAFALLWVFAGLWMTVNAIAARLHILQDEEHTYQALLRCHDSELDVAAGWWRFRTPFRDDVEFVQMQPMRLGSRLVQWYRDGAPSHWRHSGRHSAEGRGEVPIEEVRLMLGMSATETGDPTKAALASGLRSVLLGGASLSAPADGPWRDTPDFRPAIDARPSVMVLAGSALLLLAAWGAACVVVEGLRRRRYPIAAPLTPLPSNAPAARAG